MIVARERPELIRTVVVGTATAIADWGAELMRNPGSTRAVDEAAMQDDRNPVAEGIRVDSIAGYKPKTAFGLKLLQLRNEYAKQGGKFLSRDELEDEVARRRLGHDPAVRAK